MNHPRVPRAGWIVGAGIVLFIGCTLGALLISTSTADWLALWNDAYLRYVTVFSFYQALLSTLLSVIPALPVALSLYRRQFPGRTWLIRLSSITLVLPVLVGVFGIVAIYGHGGIITRFWLRWFPDSTISIYGLSGILLAHVFFNLPYASRLLLQSLESIPEEQNNLAYQLGMGAWHRFRWVEWPRLRQTFPQVFGLVFMLCFTSFATVMALGGGPKSTTIELAIYQSIKYDFDLATGAVLALWQMLLCGTMVMMLQRRSASIEVNIEMPASVRPRLNAGRWLMAWDGGWLIVLGGVLLPPLMMIVYNGVNVHIGAVLVDAEFWQAVQHSLVIASCASFLAVSIGMAVLGTSRVWRRLHHHYRANGLEMIGGFILMTPSLVISTGVFLLLRHWGNIFHFAILIVIGVNALMALPYVIKILHQPMWLVEKQYHQLCSSLGIYGWNRLKIVELRGMVQPLIQAVVMGFLLSMGDLTAIALFGSQDMQTLPLYLLQLMSSYQMDSAAVVALFLLCISVGALMLSEWFQHRLEKKRPLC